MSYANPTAGEVDKALKTLGHYRVVAAQAAAGEGPPDGIGGHHLLVLGLRETWLKNIENPAQTDKGWAQISMNYHEPFLASEPGCKVGTWTAVAGHMASEPGYVPRFTPALNYALRMLKGHKAYAESKGVPSSQQRSLRVALNGYNRGIVGAVKQYFVAIAQPGGNIDQGTTGNDYGGWCLTNSRLVKVWLDQHPNWRPTE